MEEATSRRGKEAVGDMSWLKPFYRQIRRQWQVSLLLFTALCGVVTLYTYMLNSSRFHARSMQLIVKDMGHNLWFLSEAARPLDAFSGAPELASFPDDRVLALAADRGIASTYWANILQETVQIRGMDVLLSGVQRVDDHQITEERSHLIEAFRPGVAELGYTLARDWGLGEGDEIACGDRTYTVRTVHPPRGGVDDGRLWIPLSDAQEWLDRPGEANVIRGFLCMRGLPLGEGLERLKSRIADRHPDLQVIPQMNLLEPRALARATTSGYLDYLILLMAAITALLIAATGWMEINERRYELSIMLAMGANYRLLLALFLGKLGLLAISAAAAGFLLGSLLSIHWLTPVLVTHTLPVSVTWTDLSGIMLRTLGLVIAAAAFPLINLMRLDPTRILAEE